MGNQARGPAAHQARIAPHGMPVDQHVAASGPAEGGDGADQRRLAGAIRPQQRHELPMPHDQIDAAQHTMWPK